MWLHGEVKSSQLLPAIVLRQNSELIAQGIYEVIWLERLMENLHIPLSQQTKVYSDSKLAISIVNNSVQYDRMKHVRIDRNYIKWEIGGGINLFYIPTKSQIADVFTKTMARPGFESLIDKLGMTNIYSPV